MPLLEGIAKDTTVYADKGYDSAENQQHLKEHQLLDGIMRKAHRNRPLTEVQTKRNRYLSKTRYVVEQSFGTLHRKFRYARAAYFGLIKVSAQSHLKAQPKTCVWVSTVEGRAFLQRSRITTTGSVAV